MRYIDLYLTSLLELPKCPIQPTYKIQIDQHRSQQYCYQFARPYALGPPVWFEFIIMVLLNINISKSQVLT